MTIEKSQINSGDNQTDKKSGYLDRVDYIYAWCAIIITIHLKL